jgi:hypothetical protein
MERHQTKLMESRNASAAVILPIAGMLGGLFIGGLRAYGGGLDAFAQISRVVKWGVTGFFAGLVLVVLLAVQVRRGDSVSIRRLMVLIAVAGLLTWFFSRILFGVIGFEGF